MKVSQDKLFFLHFFFDKFRQVYTSLDKFKLLMQDYSGGEKNIVRKFVNLPYWADGTNNSSSKYLMFQVLFAFFHKIFQNSLRKPFPFIYLFFL